MYTIISKIRNNIKPLNRLHNVTIYMARSHPEATIWTNYRSDRIVFQPIEISRVTRCAASGYAPLLRPKKISWVTQYTLSKSVVTRTILIKGEVKGINKYRERVFDWRAKHITLSSGTLGSFS